MTSSSFPPARSALNLRLVLASGGTVLCVFLGVLVLRAFGLLPALLLFALAVAGIVDVVVILRRRAQRAAEDRGTDDRHDSLFE